MWAPHGKIRTSLASHRVLLFSKEVVNTMESQATESGAVFLSFL